MEEKEPKPYPDKWYIITKENKCSYGESKKAVKDDKAKYYVLESYSYHSITAAGNRYNFNEFKIYNPQFKPTKIIEEGVTLKGISKEQWDKKGWGTSHIKFTISDKNTYSQDVWLEGGIGAIIHCLTLMVELSKFNTWIEYKLSKKVAEQDEIISKLKEENNALQEFSNTICLQRNSVKNIYQILFEKEIREGIQHLEKCESISDKDSAIAFGLSQKKVRDLKIKG